MHVRRSCRDQLQKHNASRVMHREARRVLSGPLKKEEGPGLTAGPAVALQHGNSMEPADAMNAVGGFRGLGFVGLGFRVVGCCDELEASQHGQRCSVGWGSAGGAAKGCVQQGVNKGVAERVVGGGGWG